MIHYILPVILSGWLGTANPGVLERVAELRIEKGWGLPADTNLAHYDGLIATEDCSLLGRSAWLRMQRRSYLVLVVDCQSRADRLRQPMSAVGLLADVNREDWNHRPARLIVRK